MIFRWSIWGESITENIDLLLNSLLSFRKQFGTDHQYIVYTDHFRFVADHLEEMANVREYPADKNSQFCVSSKATWRKWCPSSRLDINQTEVHIDSDVFLLKHPTEVDAFLLEPKTKFAIMDECLGQPYQHGAMRQRAMKDTPYVNAGFFIQKAGYDISRALINEFKWWQRNIKQDQHTHHDEQGALAIVLTKYFLNGELFIFPKDKYMIISETSNADLECLDQVTLFHATYPTHPAFYKFKSVLDGIVKEDS